MDWNQALDPAALMWYLDLEQRRSTYVRRREVTPYGVRVTVSEGGSWRYDAVRVGWDAEREQSVYVTLVEGIDSMFSAETAVAEFSSRSAISAT